MDDPVARILFWILRERGLQFLREQVDDLLPTGRGALVAQAYEQARFERCFEKPSVRFSECLRITVALKTLKINVGQREFFKMIKGKRLSKI